MAFLAWVDHNSGEQGLLGNRRESRLDQPIRRDASQRYWVLSGTLDAGDDLTITRNGQPMALNNGGDTVVLLDGQDTVHHRVTYGSAQEGRVIQV